jgi:hypothetical protein
VSEWKSRLTEEMSSLKAHSVWTLTPHSAVLAGHQIIQSRPVCHRKQNENGDITCRKVRVVAKGFTQVPGVDYGEMFAPISRLESVRTLLHIGAMNDWNINHLDVKLAFLHGEIEEEIYMEQPQGAKEKGKEDWVCKLNKNLYRLKPAGRRWVKKLYDCLTKEGFEHCAAEHSIYMRRDKLGFVMIAVHIDDMPITGDSPKVIAAGKDALWKYFEILALGPVKWLLGICVERDREAQTISLSQTAYIDTVVKRFHLKDSF